MNKAKKFGLTGLVLTGAMALGGCTATEFVDGLDDTPFGIPIAVGRKVMGGEKKQDVWAGTPVVNRMINPDGSIIFVLDSTKKGWGGKTFNSNYADRFIDTNKYESSWEWYKGKKGFIVKYTPIR